MWGICPSICLHDKMSVININKKKVEIRNCNNETENMREKKELYKIERKDCGEEMKGMKRSFKTQQSTVTTNPSFPF